MNDAGTEPAGTEPDGPEAGGFEAELHILFADERFDIQPMPGAAQHIIADARRRRSRRKLWTTTGATLGVGALLAGLTVSGLLSPRNQPEEQQAASGDVTAEPPSTVATPEVTPSTTDDPSGTSARGSALEVPSVSPYPDELPGPELVLGPHGYLSLELGMSWEDASQTGLLPDDRRAPPERGECARYPLADNPETIEDVVISGTDGVVGFRAGTAQNDQGVIAGAPLDYLYEVYPDLTREGDRYSAPTHAGRYVFTIEDNLVTEVWLVANDSDCGPQDGA